MKTPREKYLNDIHFRTLVDLMVGHIEQCNYTPSEMREAAILASIIYEEHRIRYIGRPIMPESVENGLKVMREWVDGVGKSLVEND